MRKKNKLVRQQLEVTLNKLRLMINISVPNKGWIRAIRDALGMSGRQLAERVGVTKQRIAIIEKQELAGTATINTMRKIGESLDCLFVCGYVPHKSLEQTLRERAMLVAGRRLARASQTMNLEDQALSKQENSEVKTEMIEELIDELPSNLWDEL